jgi:hypothetical protein
MGVQSADQAPAVDDRLPSEHAAALLPRPAIQHRLEQGLLEVKRAHSLAEHALKLELHVERWLDACRDR